MKIRKRDEDTWIETWSSQQGFISSLKATKMLFGDIEYAVWNNDCTRLCFTGRPIGENSPKKKQSSYWDSESENED